MTSSTFGKDIIPRVAAQNDSQPISDITEVKVREQRIIDIYNPNKGEDTFVRATYASNALATVKSGDKIKFLTVRATNFDKYAGAGGNISAVEKADFEPVFAKLDQSKLTTFVKQELAVSDKPELTSAKTVPFSYNSIEYFLLKKIFGALKKNENIFLQGVYLF